MVRFAVLCLSLLALATSRLPSTLPGASISPQLRGQLLSQLTPGSLNFAKVSADATTNTSQETLLRRASQAAAEPRIFFLFLTMSGIERPDLWQKFFENQPRNQWRALVHCKNTHLCKMQLTNNPLGITQVTTVPATYCRDLVSPMVQLLRSATLESSSARDKFVFVSESTLPVKPFREVYSTLTWDTNSDFCIYPTDHWVQLQLAQNLVALMVKHSQWVVLNKAHADTMVREWGLMNAGFNGPTWSIPAYHKPAKGPWGKIANPAGVLPLPMCVDEWAFFATIYGALVDDGLTSLAPTDLPGYGGPALQVRGPSTTATQGICRTFAFWDAADFAGSNLITEIAQDWPDSRFTCFPRCESSHPAEFSVLSDRGAVAMRRSRYLFARKFPRNVMTADQFQRIILSSTVPPKSPPKATMAHVVPLR